MRAAATLTSSVDLETPRRRGCTISLARPLPTASADRLAAVFKALSDPTRVQMLHLLKASEEPICICDFTAAFDLGQPTISHHVAKLRAAGFVTSFKQGVWSFYRLSHEMPPEARQALDLIP